MSLTCFEVSKSKKRERKKIYHYYYKFFNASITFYNVLYYNFITFQGFDLRSNSKTKINLYMSFLFIFFSSIFNNSEFY